MNTEFMITSLIVVASPGTGALVTLSAGLSHGVRTALVAALGCTLGIIPHMLLAVTGLATILYSSPYVFELIKYVGVLYLLRMGWQVLRDHSLLSMTQEETRRSHLEVIRHAVLVNLLNPKLTIFFFAFLPQFIAQEDATPMLSMVYLSLVFMTMTLAVFGLYGCFAAAVRDKVLASKVAVRWLRRSFAAAFVALGAKLAMAQR